MRIGRFTVNAEFLAKVIHQFPAAAEGAGKRAADADVILAGCILAEAGIESDDFEDLDRLQFEFLCDPIDGLRRDESELMLNDMQ